MRRLLVGIVIMVALFALATPAFAQEYPPQVGDGGLLRRPPAAEKPQPVEQRSEDRLVDTGADVGSQLVVGLALAAAGGVILVATRRRRAAQAG
jgi:hypothetical protein